MKPNKFDIFVIIFSILFFLILWKYNYLYYNFKQINIFGKKQIVAEVFGWLMYCWIRLIAACAFAIVFRETKNKYISHFFLVFANIFSFSAFAKIAMILGIIKEFDYELAGQISILILFFFIIVFGGGEIIFNKIKKDEQKY